VKIGFSLTSVLLEDEGAALVPSIPSMVIGSGLLGALEGDGGYPMLEGLVGLVGNCLRFLRRLISFLRLSAISAGLSLFSLKTLGAGVGITSSWRAFSGVQWRGTQRRRLVGREGEWRGSKSRLLLRVTHAIAVGCQKIFISNQAELHVI